jgi:RNA polymerase sigma-70 factor, ECF subfamily
MMSEVEKVIEELVTVHGGFVRALALRLAPGPGLADDIAQQVFLEFIGKAAEWDLARDVQPLLAVMTRNVARRCWRERTRDLPDVQNELAEHIRQLAEPRDPGWFGEEEMAALRRCLERLPGKSRRLVELHYYLDISSVEIAERTSLSPEAVRRALFRVREQLRKCVQRFLPKEFV